MPGRRANTSSKSTFSEAPDVLNVPMMAGLLGISVGSAYAAVARGSIPGVVRIGRRIIASKSAIRSWLDGGTVGVEESSSTKRAPTDHNSRRRRERRR